MKVLSEVFMLGVPYLSVVGNNSTAIEIIMLLATLADAWKIDESTKTLGVPLAKYKPELKPPAINDNTTIRSKEWFKLHLNCSVGIIFT